MMADFLRVALIQMTSGRDMAANLAHIADQVALAKAAGAQFALTPENAAMLEPIRAQAMAKAAPESAHPALPVFAGLAARHGMWLLAGSLAIQRPDGKLVNRSFLFDDHGRQVAAYSKIHLFDVDLPGGERYRESQMFEAGDRAVVADSPWGGIGMSVCYDVRFAHLYRQLAQAGAGILTAPSAFTVPTGQAHWHVLLRARAIETGCFVLAPAQTGLHAEGRRTYGHSLVVAPWGEVLADGGGEPGLVIADLDLGAIGQARGRVPSLTHDRPFTSPG